MTSYLVNRETLERSLHLLTNLNDARRLHLPGAVKTFEAKLDEHDLRCGYDKAVSPHFGEPVPEFGERGPQHNPKFPDALPQTPVEVAVAERTDEEEYDPDKCPSCGQSKGEGRCMACGFS